MPKPFDYLFKNRRILIFLTFFLLTGFCVVPNGARAEMASALKEKINDKQNDIADLDAQIEKLSKDLNQVESQKQTLTSELRRIELTGQAIGAKIKKTNQQINLTNLNIDKTEKEIGSKEFDISQGKDLLADSIKIIRDKDTSSILEIVLAERSISTFLREINALQKIQKSVSEALLQLKIDKGELGAKKNALKQEIGKMVRLKNTLDDEKKINNSNQEEKKILIKETKNQEANFIKLIEEIKEKRAKFEKELFDFESQLKITIDPTSYPKDGTIVFSWPLEKIYITQYFGNTEFASRNTRAYAGLGHNGVDLRASVGTRVLAPSSGIVRGTGDTDLTCRKASYGRWLLIDHGNGLTTLYAHLSLIKAKEGERVNEGDVIAYSGNTGYSTGPHLHFSTFVTRGVEIGRLQSRVRGCGIYTLPRAAFNAYLNPLSYLPVL